MVHLNPESIAADITSVNPKGLYCVSPFTIKTNPMVMTLTTAAKFQLGLHKIIGAWHDFIVDENSRSVVAFWSYKIRLSSMEKTSFLAIKTGLIC